MKTKPNPTFFLQFRPLQEESPQQASEPLSDEQESDSTVEVATSNRDRRVVLAGYHYVYVLMSQLDHSFYIGVTGDLSGQLWRHGHGWDTATCDLRPLVLIYFEGCRHFLDALLRKEWLNGEEGREFLFVRIKNDGPGD